MYAVYLMHENKSISPLSKAHKEVDEVVDRERLEKWVLR